MAAATAPEPPARARLAAAGTLVRRSLAELAVLAQVVLGGAVVLAAAERRSVLASANHGAFTAWFAGPLRGLWPALPRNPEVLHSDMHRALLALLAAWLVVALGGRTVRPGPVIS